MCGIAGIIAPSHLDSQRISEAVETISHRGPDETGFFRGAKCHLGIARLAIVDVKEGHQPCFSENEDLISVFNGEIYNFRELRELLLKKGHFLPSNSDSELIPHLYEEFGEEFPKKLQGMFAIALYVKSQEKLFLIRDRLGKKPIWFSNQDESLYFCSELKGLFSLGVKKSFDTSILNEYLSNGYVNAPRSPFKNVEQVKPGSIVRFHNGSTTSVSYWRPEDIPEDPISWNDAIEKGEELIKSAVRERLFSERPLGVFLSGGVDSALVAAMAVQELGQLETFSIGFDESEYDESNYAHEISQFLKTKHHSKIVTPNPLLILEEITKMLDLPFADSSIIPSFILSKFAREKVVVALSGDGGDEAFGGYDRYRANHYLSYLNPAIRLNPLKSLSSKLNAESRKGKFLRGLIQSDSYLRYLELQANVPWQTVAKLTKSKFVIDDAVAFLDLSSSRPSSDIRSMQILDLKGYLPGDLLYKVDITSMANGLEVRSPLLDFRVVEFGLSLPEKYKVNPKLNKLLLREILKKYIPEKMINRPKKGFAIPRASWIRGELRPLIMETLVTNHAWLNVHLDQKEISRIVKRHMDGINHDATIWSLLMLELWAQKWLCD